MQASARYQLPAGLSHYQKVTEILSDLFLRFLKQTAIALIRNNN